MKHKYTTQTKLSKELGVSVQVINNWIARKNDKIESKVDKVTGKTLVRLKE